MPSAANFDTEHGGKHVGEWRLVRSVPVSWFAAREEALYHVRFLPPGSNTKNASSGKIQLLQEMDVGCNNEKSTRIQSNLKAMPTVCKHPRVRIVSRHDDAEFVECLECGEIFDSEEFHDMEIEETVETEEAESEY
jgi:hypothetical protein